MTLPPGEPAAGPWHAAPVSHLVALLREAAGPVVGRPCVVAVDGRGGSGKSTLAAIITAAAWPSTVVHTDDIAWHHAFFDWADLLARHVLQPVRAGRPVSYRPPGWVARGRTGAVEVPAGLDLVVVEGTGAGRRELEPLLDAVVWVQADAPEAKRRALARDVAAGDNGDLASATRFWDEWREQELPFLAEQRPWERAAAVVAGTGPGAGPGRVLLASPGI